MRRPFLCSAPSNTNPQLLNSTQKIFHLKRRNIDSGWIDIGDPCEVLIPDDITTKWQKNQPIFLPNFLAASLDAYANNIASAKMLYQALLVGQEIDDLLDQPEYLTRLGDKFELLSTRFDESDRQELVSVDFDVMENGELAMEDIWMRVSWLSFLDAEESLRFRFSFGMEGFDDVSLDFERQLAAAELCGRIFPESGLLCRNDKLKELIKDLVGVDDLRYVERIVYYNARNGGAQFHHDAEKGHLGVVYAQLTGQTFWLALSKRELLSEMQMFLREEKNRDELALVIKDKVAFEKLLTSASDPVLLETLLDDPTNDEVSELLNESPTFFAQLMSKDYGYALKPGDIILLPQQSMQNCAWHSVFCLGDEAGQALSFAVKAT